MFRGNHRTFFHLNILVSDYCGNHSQLETCSRKSRAEYQNERFFFFLRYVLLPFLFFCEAMFQKNEKRF